VDSCRSPCGLYGDSQDFIWTPDGVHQDVWLSVTNSLQGTLSDQIVTADESLTSGKVKPSLPGLTLLNNKIRTDSDKEQISDLSNGELLKFSLKSRVNRPKIPHLRLIFVKR
jgi:hypothetical protein